MWSAQRASAGVIVALLTIVGLRWASRTSPTPAAATPSSEGDAACGFTQAPISLAFADGELLAICDAVYTEPGLDPSAVVELRLAHETARDNIARAFGDALRSTPLTIFCHTAACKLAFGASPAVAGAEDLGFARDAVETKSGRLVRSTVVVTGPVSGTARILTHELVHAEMKAWVAYDSLPTWFNEGMATFLADEPHCDADAASPGFDVTTLDSKRAWEAHIRAHGDTLRTYCRARNRVEAWASRFDAGAPRAEALRRLMTSVAAGVPFDRAYDL